MSEPFWRLHIDYGTGNISAEYILCRRKADGTIMKIGGSVVFKNRETFAPAKYAWTNEGVFVWGCQLETLIREHKIAPGKVLKSFKTLLVDKHDHTAVVRSCLKRIYTSEDDIEDVLYASLKAIINDIRLYVRTRNKQCDLTPAQIDDLYVELSIGVPNEITIESIRYVSMCNESEENEKADHIQTVRGRIGPPQRCALECQITGLVSRISMRLYGRDRTDQARAGMES